MLLNDEVKERLSGEAERIGSQLLSFMEVDQDGNAYWKTLDIRDNEYLWELSEHLYSGTAGISLFLLELYKHTKNNIFLDAVVSSAKWLEKQFITTNPSHLMGSFFTGQTGIAFFFLKLHEETGNSRYLDIPLKIGREVASGEMNGKYLFDLLNGEAGTLIGLLHIYKSTKDAQVLKNIFSVLRTIIDNTKIYKEGCYWDIDRGIIKPLCGFSHGTSGIALAIDEFAKCFGMIDLSILSHFARKYENLFYSDEYNNWPDFRKGYYNEETRLGHIRAYEGGEKDFFTKPTYSNAWCHGALGIAFSRLNSLQLYGLRCDESDLSKALKLIEDQILPIEKNSLNNFTLCHGSGAIIDLYLLLHEFDQSNDYHNKALAIGLEAINSREIEGQYYSGFSESKLEDLSLFMGIAGIGYQLLRLLNPDTTFSVLFPIVNRSNTNIKKETAGKDLSDFILEFSRSKLYLGLCKNTYPRTIRYLFSKLGEQIVYKAFDSNINTEINSEYSLQELIDSIALNLNNRDLHVFMDIFNLEAKIEDMREQTESNAEIAIEQELQSAHILDAVNLEDNQMLLSINPRAIVHQCLYNWHEEANFPPHADTSKQEIYTVVLLITPETIQEFWITEFTRILMMIFTEPILFSDAKTKFSSLFSNIENEKISHFYSKQVSELLMAGILFFSKPKHL